MANESAENKNLNCNNAPSFIELDSLIVDLDFHPAKDVIASCTIDGSVFIHSYALEGSNHELMKLTHHKKACRGVSFSEDGQLLFTISKDKSLQIVDMETGSVVHNISKAHKDPLYSLLVIDNYLAATGDDEGNLKVWDFRRQSAVMELKQCDEYISDMVIDDNKRILLATSGEGTLSAFNVRKKQLELQSELFESEFLCLDILKNDSKVAVGSGDGTVNIFNFNEWGNVSDMFPGHPESVDAMIAINDDIICTGSIDGAIRAVNILPNRFLGIVGRHDEFPVENLSLSHDGNILASCSHDQKIKFWNISCLDDVEEQCPSAKPKKETKSKTLNKKETNFFAGLE